MPETTLIGCVSAVENAAEALMTVVRRDHPDLTPGDYRPVLKGMGESTELLRLSLIRFGGVLRSYYLLAEQNGHVKQGTGDIRRTQCGTAALNVGKVGRHSDAALGVLNRNFGRTIPPATAQNQNAVVSAVQRLHSGLYELSLTAAQVKPPTVADLKNFTYLEDMFRSLLATVEHLGYRNGVCQYLTNAIAFAHKMVGKSRQAGQVVDPVADYGKAMDKVAKKIRDAYAEVSGDVTLFNRIAKATTP